MTTPSPGHVVRFRCKFGITLGIVKKPRTVRRGTRTFNCVVVYVPGTGDAPILPRQISDPHPWCEECTCTGCQWYWRGGEPLFPAEILCIRCHPPTADQAWIRAEVADAFACIRPRMAPEEFDHLAVTAEGLAQNPWPEVRKVLWACWLAVTAGPPATDDGA